MVVNTLQLFESRTIEELEEPLLAVTYSRLFADEQFNLKEYFDEEEKHEIIHQNKRQLMMQAITSVARLEGDKYVLKAEY
jgi:hypothetical protein